MSATMGHLDDDRLSDLIDGVGTGEDLAHVAACDHCSARVRQWRGVLGEVSRPPATSPKTRDAAVAIALSHATTDLSPGPDGQIVDLSERRARRGRRLLASVAAAAVALVVGVSAALLAGSGGNPNHHATVASPRSGSTTPSAGASGGTASAGSGAGLSGSYLGNIDNAAQLVSALRSLPAAPFPAVPAGGSAGSAQSAAGSSENGPGISPSGISSSGGSACAPPSVPGAALKDISGLTWKGTPATVFVYSGPHGYTAYVRSDSGCSVLATVSY